MTAPFSGVGTMRRVAWVLALCAASAAERIKLFVYDAQNIDLLWDASEWKAAKKYRSFFALGEGRVPALLRNEDFEYPGWEIARQRRQAVARRDDVFEVVDDLDAADAVFFAVWDLGLCAAMNDLKGIQDWQLHKGVLAWDSQCRAREAAYEALTTTARFRRRTGRDYAFLAENVGYDRFFYRELPQVAGPKWLPVPSEVAAVVTDNAVVVTVEDEGYRPRRWSESRAIVVPYHLQRDKWYLDAAALPNKQSLAAFVGTVNGTVETDICPHCRNGVTPTDVRRALVSGLVTDCARNGVRCDIQPLDVITEAGDSRNDQDLIARHFSLSQPQRDSKFCLVPRGDDASSRRLYCAIVSLCVPVVVSDNFVFPFASQLPWDDLVIRLDENDVVHGRINVFDLLQNVTQDELKRRQAALITHRDTLLYDGGAVDALLEDYADYLRREILW